MVPSLYTGLKIVLMPCSFGLCRNRVPIMISVFWDKCKEATFEREKNIYVTFVDLKKTFDNAPQRNGLYMPSTANAWQYKTWCLHSRCSQW